MSTSTSIIKQNIKITLIAEVPWSQALPDFLITAPASVCVPDVIGVLASSVDSKPKKKNLVVERGGVGASSSKIAHTVLLVASSTGKLRRPDIS